MGSKWRDAVNTSDMKNNAVGYKIVTKCGRGGGMKFTVAKCNFNAALKEP